VSEMWEFSREQPIGPKEPMFEFDNRCLHPRISRCRCRF